MKNCFVLLVLCALTATVTAVRRQRFEDGLRKLIDKWKHGNLRSLPIPLPSLTPFRVPAMTNQDESGLFTISNSEVKVYGFEDMSVNQLSVSRSGMISIDVTIPQLKFRADWYHLQMEPLDFYVLVVETLNVEGSVYCDVTGIRVRGHARLRADGSSTVISHLDLEYSVNDVQLYLSGTSRSITDEILQEVWRTMYDRQTKEWLQDAIKKEARMYLRGYTPQELANMISSI